MCLLIVKQAGEIIPAGVIARALVAHPDGVGVAWHDATAGRVYRRRSLDWDMWDLVEFIDDLRDSVAIVHFRWATHGARTIRNVHPFRITGGYLAHNGIIDDVASSRKVSDTRAWVRDEIRGMPVGILRRYQQEIDERIGPGNRVATIHDSGEILTFGGSWYVGERSGNLYSNRSGFGHGKGEGT